jgi:hypothetical protein
MTGLLAWGEMIFYVKDKQRLAKYEGERVTNLPWNPCNLTELGPRLLALRDTARITNETDMSYKTKRTYCMFISSPSKSALSRVWISFTYTERFKQKAKRRSY